MPLALQRLGAGHLLARHRHAEPYAALVLSGSYEEAGDAGRIIAGPGTLIVHGAFDAHLNRVGSAGSTLINLPLEAGVRSQIRKVEDADQIVRLAESDPTAAAQLSLSLSSQFLPSNRDWPDMLAEELRADPSLNLARWADDHGLAAGSLSRGFKRVFGLTPKRFRNECRTRLAVEILAAGSDPIADVAVDCGFADQAHLHRSVVAVTGRTPRTMRFLG